MKAKKYLKYFFETSRTIVFKEYYFFSKPSAASLVDAFPEELLYFLFLSKKVVILRKNNELKVKRKYGIKNLRLIESNSDEFK